MQQKTIFFCFLALILIILNRCANPVSPSGGPKDIQPPETVRCNPPNLSTHFTAKEIRIEFDEFIQLKDPNKEITISPPWLPNNDYKIRGKSIIVKLNDSLRANRTYAFNFGNAITDITENNVLHNFIYVFSTGSYIDSLSLMGEIKNASDLAPQKDVLAMLYLDDNDSIPFDSLPYKVKPHYLTRTEDNGEFSLIYLSDSSFKIFALKDINNNSIYDLPDEKIAFLDTLVKGSYKAPAIADAGKKDTIIKDTIIKDTNIKDASLKDISLKDTIITDSVKVSPVPKPLISLRLFQQYDSIQRLIRSDLIQEGQIGLFFRYPLKHPGFIPLNFAPFDGWTIEDINRNHDTVFLWLIKLPYDSLVLQLLDDGKVIDTIEMDLTKKTEKSKGGKKDAAQVKKLNIKSNCTAGYFKQFRNDLILTFSYPLCDYNFSAVSLVDDKDTLKPKIVLADSLKKSIYLFYKWKEEKRYKIIIPDSSFYAINDITNDSLIIDFKTRSARDYGSFKIKINSKDPEAQYIIQLLNEKDGLLDQRKLTGSGVVEFNYLSALKYKIKAIYDSNKNGRWDIGDYLNKLQPEKVSIFPKTLEIRSNWEIEEAWDL
jgi:hypothetical protein